MAVIGQPNSAMEIVDPGIYPAWIKIDPSDHELTSSYQGGPEKPRLKFHMMVDAGPEIGELDLWYYTNATLSKHAAAKFRPLVRAVLPDVDLDAVASIDTNDLNTKWCRVLVGLNEEQDRNVIERVLPYETAPVRKPMPPPARAAAQATPQRPAAAPARPQRPAVPVGAAAGGSDEAPPF